MVFIDKELEIIRLVDDSISGDVVFLLFEEIVVSFGAR